MVTTLYCFALNVRKLRTCMLWEPRGTYYLDEVVVVLPPLFPFLYNLQFLCWNLFPTTCYPSVLTFLVMSQSLHFGRIRTTALSRAGHVSQGDPTASLVWSRRALSTYPCASHMCTHSALQIAEVHVLFQMNSNKNSNHWCTQMRQLHRECVCSYHNFLTW